MKISHLKTSLGIVFSKPSYVTMALTTAVLVVLISTTIGNYSLIAYTIRTNPSGIFALTISFFKSLSTNFSIGAAITTVSTALLFGMALPMIIYSTRMKMGSDGVKRGGLGMLAGMFGVGCASCGSFLLTSILSLFGAAGFVAALPLRGVEFALIGIALLVVSIHSASKSIAATCDVRRLE